MLSYLILYIMMVVKMELVFMMEGFFFFMEIID